MTFRKAISLLLAALMILSCATVLVSCNKGTSKIPKTKREHVYREQVVDGITIPGYVNNIFTSGDDIIMNYDVTYTLVMDESGNEVERFEGYYSDINGGGFYEYPIDDGFIAYAEDLVKNEDITNDVEEEISIMDPIGTQTTLEKPTTIETPGTIEIPTTIETPELPEEVPAPAPNDGVIDMPAPAPIVPVTPLDPKSGEERKLEGEPDEYGVITDENNNISVPEGWWVQYTTETVFRTVTVDGTEKGIVKMSVDNLPEEVTGGWASYMFVGNDGKLNTVYDNYSYDETSGMSSEMLYIVKSDLETGEILDVKCLNDCFAAAQIDPMNTYFSSIVMLDDGSFCFNMGEGDLYFVDGDMNFLRKQHVCDGYLYSLSKVGDMILVRASDANYTNESYYIIRDGQAEKLDMSAIGESYIYDIIGGNGSRIYFRKLTGVWYFDLDTKEGGVELDFMNSDIDYTNMNRMMTLSDGRMLMLVTDWNTGNGETTMSVLTKVPDEQIEEEIILTIGTVWYDYDLVRAVFAYNKQSNGVRFAIKSYEDYNNEENGWNGAVTQLNSEIVTGSMPDIVMLDSSLPTQSYFQKGVFADLNKFIDAEEGGLDRSKYLDNILRASETNGKLYSLITDYMIYSIAIKTKFADGKTKWTFDEMMDAVKNMPEGMEMFYGSGRNEILSVFLETGMGGLINWENGDAKFDTQSFRDFITYLAKCPELGLWEEYYSQMSQVTEEYVYDEEKERELSEQYALRYWNDKSLLGNASIYSFNAIMNIYSEFASKDVTFIGFPTDSEDGNGALIMPTKEFAISAKSPAKQQAWDFIKYYVENSADKYNFTLSLDALQESADEALKNYGKDSLIGGYVHDYEWLKQRGYSDDYINYMMNSNMKLDQEMIDAVWALLRGANTVARSDSELNDIINEELSAFFAGTKSVEETSRVIASRAKIMISTKS